MKYSVDYLINFFENISEDNWSTGRWRESLVKRCAVGHLITETGDVEAQYDLYSALKFTGELTININDGLSKVYSQKTPKQRILAALRDSKK